jgi:type IV pilus assembly protein PilC
MANNLATVYHNLSIMLGAGIPVQRSLKVIAEGLKGQLQKTFMTLANDVSTGKSLSEIMSKYPNVFATLDVMLMDAADISGNLPETYKMLSQWYDLKNRLKKRLISGLIFPFAIIHIAALVAPLPFLFLGIFGVDGYIMLAAIILSLFYIPMVVILAASYLLPGSGTIRRFLDAIVLKFPILGSAVRQLALSRYCQAFNMMYKAGIPIIQCAQQAPGVTGNAIMADIFRGGAESAQAGNMVCEGFSNKLPVDFLNIWQIGEETGELDNCLKRLADNTTETAEQLFVELVQWIPRIVYWLVCALLAVLILIAAAKIYGSLPI